MKFIIEKKYLKISIYVVFTLILFYAFKRIIDIAVFSLANIDAVISGFLSITGRIFSLISLPFTGFVIAYLLDPLCDFFDRLYSKKTNKKSERRTMGVIMTYFFLILLIVFFVWFLWIYTAKGIKPLEYLNRAYIQFDGMYKNAVGFLIRHDMYDFSIKYIDSLRNSFLGFFDRIWPSALEGAADIGGIFLDLILGFVIAFYFLLDKKSFLNGAKTAFKILMPKKLYNVCAKTALDCHMIFSGYIRGQLTDGIIMSLLTASFLTIFKIKFAVLIGIITGFSNIIPYFGGIVGFSLAVLSALLSGERIKAVYAAIIMIALQQIDSAVIVPKIVGEKVSLSPPAVICALAIGGRLGGIWGMILAVPCAGIIKTIIIKRYLRK